MIEKQEMMNKIKNVSHIFSHVVYHKVLRTYLAMYDHESSVFSI